MQRIIEVANYCRKFSINIDSVRELFWQLDLCNNYKISIGDLSIAFVSKQCIKKVHLQFFNDSSFTDVITFHGDKQFDSAGEILVSPEYALSRIDDFQTTLQKEVTLYLIHGFLHLSGLKDKTPEDAQLMRKAEEFCQNFINNFTIDIKLNTNKIKNT